MDRRDFLRLLGLGAAAGFTAVPMRAFAAAPLKVVIVGGGMAGATAARYLRLWGPLYDLDVQVTLIDSNARYVSCIMSNKVVTGETTLTRLTYGYAALQAAGVVFRNATVRSVDAAGRRVLLSDGSSLPYDRLILAPGIDFDYSTVSIAATGLTQAQALAAVPHAWKAGPQTTTLRNQLAAITNGNTIVLSIPAAPYRCPPGPYERACAIADWLKRNRPASKLVVLDANPQIMAEPVNFGNAFASLYRNQIDYRPGIAVESVRFAGSRPKVKTVTGVDAIGQSVTVTAEVVNLIPKQRAGKIAIQTLGPTGLTPDGRWALVDETTYESRRPGIHVIGDSIASKQPKAGHVGNQEAKICVDAILRLATGKTPYATPVTNSACFTPITSQTATWLTAVYRLTPDIDAVTGKPTGTKSMKIVSGNPPGTPSETPTAPSKDNYEAMQTWFASLMVDTFG